MMSLTNLVPWKRGTLRRNEADPFVSLRDEVNHAFDSFFSGDLFAMPAMSECDGGRMSLTPTLDVSETDNDVQLNLELPGMTEKDIEVELLENAVKIHGEKKDERETKDRNFHRTERTFGSFERIVPLPVKVKRDSVSATFKNGVLSVTLPKAEPGMAHQKIPVTGA